MSIGEIVSLYTLFGGRNKSKVTPLRVVDYIMAILFSHDRDPKASAEISLGLVLLGAPAFTASAG